MFADASEIPCNPGSADLEYHADVQHIGKVLPAVLRKRGLEHEAVASSIVALARQWIATNVPDLREMIEVEPLRDGVLTIACSHAIALQEAQAFLPHLLDEIRASPGGQRLRSGRVVRARSRPNSALAEGRFSQ